MSTLTHSRAAGSPGARVVARSASRTWAPWLLLSVPLALLGLAGSVAAIFVDSVYAKETANWAAQATGQDIANLLVFPGLLVAAALAWRGSLRAYVVWAGLLVASAYSYAIYAFDVPWGRLFLLDVAVLGLSAWSLAGGLAALDRRDLARRFHPAAPVRAAAGVLVALAAAFMLLWLSIEVPALVSGTPADELADTGLVTNPVHVLDLALFLPAAIVAGVLLWRRHVLGLCLAPVMLAAMIAISVGLVALMLVAAHRGLDWSPVVLAGNVVIALVEGVVLTRLLGAIREEGGAS